MDQLSAPERAWIWTARLAGLSLLGFAAIGLHFQIPAPAYVIIGGLLGGEFVYKASRKNGEQ